MQKKPFVEVLIQFPYGVIRRLQHHYFLKKHCSVFFLLTYLITHCPDDYSI